MASHTQTADDADEHDDLVHHGDGAHGDGAHGHGGADHVPHVLPLKTYFATFGTLLVLTVVTVAASRFDFGAANLFIALAIALIKATVVAAIFMHLKWDLRFHAIALGSSLVFLGIFVTFTMFDTNYRGQADGVESQRAYDVKRPFLGTRAEGAERARRHLPPPGTALPASSAAPVGAATVPATSSPGAAPPVLPTAGSTAGSINAPLPANAGKDGPQAIPTTPPGVPATQPKP